MNEKAIMEIGTILYLKSNKKFNPFVFTIGKVRVEDILISYEYKLFKEKYPEICRLAEK